jgi:hypothetical protein
VGQRHGAFPFRAKIPASILRGGSHMQNYA